MYSSPGFIMICEKVIDSKHFRQNKENFLQNSLGFSAYQH